MKFKKLTPILWTENIQETLDFYINILGFTCNEYNKDWQWAALHNSDCEIMITHPNTHSNNKIAFSGSFYFEVDKVESLWNNIKDKAEIVYALDVFDWGMKEFAVKDNNGYILQFGSLID